MLASYINRISFIDANKPLWNSEESSLKDINVVLNNNDGFLLTAKNDALILKRTGNDDEQVLIDNYSSKISVLKIYYKDLDLDRKNEIVFLVNNTDIHVFGALVHPKLSRYTLHKFVRAAEKILFNENDQLYIQSCGSQYCNDAFYSWDENMLSKTYVDTYTSW